MEASLAGSGLRALVQPPEGNPGRHLPPKAREALHAILLEALLNTRKHARATRVWVYWTEEPAGGSLRVEDDGCGFAANTRVGHGLAASRRRASAHGLNLCVCSAPGSGTRIDVTWPTAPDAGTTLRPPGAAPAGRARPAAGRRTRTTDAADPTQAKGGSGVAARALPDDARR